MSLPRKKRIERKAEMKEEAVQQPMRSDAVTPSETEQFNYYLKLPQNEVASSTGNLIKRTLAVAIDIVLFYLFMFLPYFYIFSSMAGIPQSTDFTKLMDYLLMNSALMAKINVAFMGAGVLLLMYFVIFQLLYRATPGMMAFSLHLRGDLGNFPVLKLIVRNLSFSLFPFAIIIDIIAIFFTEKKQRLSDVILGLHVERSCELKIENEVL
jgi:hypothetical protein